MEDQKTLYDLEYFETRDEAAQYLEFFADEKRPLILPKRKVLHDVVLHLQAVSNRKSLNINNVLTAYQSLREAQLSPDIFCAWKDNKGLPCGGQMHIKVNAAGAYYECTINHNHRTPK